MQSIADRLIFLRNKYNLSQTDVAHQIGVTPALISAYEKLERKPSIDKLIALADIFHVSTDYILGRTFKDDSSAVISVEGLTEKQVKIVRDLISELKNNNKTPF
ncbi:MAG: helix-turn-helix domain-containing protein [Lachnospiraceae bacterium]|nr:helix-turn-helix domain-containing protein [Lachnospiraceae bacterium]